MAEADMFEKLKWAASTGLDLSPGDPLAAWAVAEIERLRTALEQCNEYRDDPHKIIGIVDAALAGMPPYDFKRNAHETSTGQALCTVHAQIFDKEYFCCRPAGHEGNCQIAPGLDMPSENGSE